MKVVPLCFIIKVYDTSCATFNRKGSTFDIKTEVGTFLVCAGLHRLDKAIEFYQADESLTSDVIHLLTD